MGHIAPNMGPRVLDTSRRNTGRDTEWSKEPSPLAQMIASLESRLLDETSSAYNKPIANDYNGWKLMNQVESVLASDGKVASLEEVVDEADEEEVVADEHFDEVVDLSDDESSDECDNGQFDEVMELSDDESDVESEAEEMEVTVIRSEPVFEVTLADDYDSSEDEQIFDVPSDDESEDDTMGRFDEAVYLTDDDDSDEPTPVTELAQLDTLRALDLSHCQGVSVLAALAQNNRLHTLNLSQCEDLTDVSV